MTWPSAIAWTPAERRRLARADAHPGRRFPRRVDRGKPIYRGFTRNSLEDMVLLAVPGLRPRHVTIKVTAPGSLLVTLSGATTRLDCEAAAAAIDPMRPAGILIDFALAPRAHHETDPRAT